MVSSAFTSYLTPGPSREKLLHLTGMSLRHLASVLGQGGYIFAISRIIRYPAMNYFIAISFQGLKGDQGDIGSKGESGDLVRNLFFRYLFLIGMSFFLMVRFRVTILKLRKLLRS